MFFKFHLGTSILDNSTVFPNEERVEVSLETKVKPSANPGVMKKQTWEDAVLRNLLIQYRKVPCFVENTRKEE